MKHKALVCSLYGGPGSGKSTSATGAFSRLKILGVNAEYVGEYAKDLCWSDRKCDNQVLILGKQYDRLWRLRDKIDVIVTDSPLLLTPLYNRLNLIHIPSLDTVARDLYDQFHNLDIFIKRVKPYNPAGRYQNEDQARLIDGDTRAMLEAQGVKYHEVPGNEEGIEQIVKATLLALTLK
jgi:hypothetical protein